MNERTDEASSNRWEEMEQEASNVREEDGKAGEAGEAGQGKYMRNLMGEKNIVEITKCVTMEEVRTAQAEMAAELFAVRQSENLLRERLSQRKGGEGIASPPSLAKGHFSNAHVEFDIFDIQRRARARQIESGGRSPTGAPVVDGTLLRASVAYCKNQGDSKTRKLGCTHQELEHWWNVPTPLIVKEPG